jgi:hypothetical protein
MCLVDVLLFFFSIRSYWNSSHAGIRSVSQPTNIEPSNDAESLWATLSRQISLWIPSCNRVDICAIAKTDILHKHGPFIVCVLGYWAGTWWWELADTLHKLILSCLLVFLPTNSQLPIGMFVAMVYCVAILVKAPYLRRFDDRTAICVQSELILLLLAGYCLQNKVRNNGCPYCIVLRSLKTFSFPSNFLFCFCLCSRTTRHSNSTASLTCSSQLCSSVSVVSSCCSSSCMRC